MIATWTGKRPRRRANEQDGIRSASPERDYQRVGIVAGEPLATLHSVVEEATHWMREGISLFKRTIEL